MRSVRTLLRLTGRLVFGSLQLVYVVTRKLIRVALSAVAAAAAPTTRSRSQMVSPSVSDVAAASPPAPPPSTMDHTQDPEAV